MSLVRINRKWAPLVRYAARRYKRALKKAQRRFEKDVAKGTTEGEAMSTLCAEEAQALMSLLRRLGYGGDRRKAPARDRMELELMVHELDPDVSHNFFRVFLAQQKDKTLLEVFSRRGRERTLKEVEELRLRHIRELSNALRAREAIVAWLSQYFKGLELRKRYTELTRMQFDDSIDEEVRLSYLSLLFAQIAEKTGRERGDVLREYEAVCKALVQPEAGAGDEVDGEEGSEEEEAVR